MIKVLIVDDSAVVRKVLTEELSKFDDIVVVGSAIDPYMAREKIAELQPDVMTLDVEMPRMDGITFLSKLMAHHPIPVIVVSSLTPENSENAMRALELGAIDIVSKPSSQFSIPDVKNILVRAIRVAAKAKVMPIAARPQNAQVASRISLDTTHKIIALGASTGGTQALEAVMRDFPANAPGTVIVQHMPIGFTTTFARRLNSVSQMEVREAKNGDAVVPGIALLAPGNQHMLLERSGATYRVVLKDGPQVHFQRPAVDILFNAVAKHAGHNAVGAILTGMGADGAKGLLAMRTAGAKTLAQDEATCVVYGMPREAVKLNAVDKIVPLQNVTKTIMSMLNHSAKASA